MCGVLFCVAYSCDCQVISEHFKLISDNLSK